MHLKRNKKIFFYFLIFLIFSTINNKYFIKIKFSKINEINVYGLDKNQNLKISKDLEMIKFKNLFFLDKNLIDKILKPYNIIENYFVFKHYPSSISITLFQTNFLAVTKKKENSFYIGSNGKLIKKKDDVKNLPQLFGNFEIDEFLILKKIIDNSNFDYLEIKNLFFFKSGRWDIETNRGIIIKLPIDYSEENLNFVYDLLHYQDFKDKKLIDIRQKSQVVSE
tara:strand:- start:1223 stop:1891 length:669 start_codon:yes stop_codon:yes gene_type:complete